MVHFLHVVAVFEHIDQTQQLRRRLGIHIRLVDGIIETSAASAFRPAASSASRTAPISSRAV